MCLIVVDEDFQMICSCIYMTDQGGRVTSLSSDVHALVQDAPFNFLYQEAECLSRLDLVRVEEDRRVGGIEHNFSWRESNLCYRLACRLLQCAC